MKAKKPKWQKPLRAAQLEHLKVAAGRSTAATMLIGFLHTRQVQREKNIRCVECESIENTLVRAGVIKTTGGCRHDVPMR